MLDSSEQPSYLDESIQYKAEVRGFHFVKVKGTRFFDSGVYDLTVLITDFKVVNVDWGTSTSTPEVGPGDVGIPLQVTIRNGVSHTVEDLTATLNVSGSFSNSTGGSTVVAHFSDEILSGKTGIFTFTLNVAEDAAIGSHNFSLNLNYKMRTSSDLIEGSPEDLAVTVFLLGKVNLAVSTETKNLTPGELNTIDAQFKNTGTATASAVEVILTAPTDLILAGAENRLYFNKIRPGEVAEASIPVQVSSAAAGSLVQLGLSVAYIDAYGNTRSTSRSLGFKVEAERVLFKVAESFWGAAGSPLEVGPGDDGVTLRVQVQNLGENVVTGLHGTLYLKPPFGKEFEGDIVSSTYGVAVQPGQVGVFEFVFDVDDDAAVGLYLLNMEMDYLLVKGEQYQKAEPVSLTVPVLLLGKVDIAVSPSVTSFRPDELNYLEISILNQGTGDASAVDITITAPLTISLKETDSHIFLSSLKAGAVAQIEVSAFVPLSAAGTTLQFTVSTSYRDPYGTVRSASRVLGFTVEKLEEGADLKVVDMVWGSLGSAIEVGLGDRNIPLTMVIENLGVSPVTGILAELRLPSPFMNSTGGNIVSGYYGGVIQPGGTANIQFTVDLADEGTIGQHILGVSIQYLIVKGDVYETAEQRGLTASLVLKGKVDLQVSVSKNILTAETVNGVKITVTNVGDTRISDLAVTVTPPTLISISSGGNQFNLGNIEPDGERSLDLSLFAPQSTAGSSPQGQLTLTYKDSYGAIRSESRTFGLIVREWLSPLTVSTGENILTIGKASEPDIEIMNVGETPIYSLKATLDLPSGAGASPIVLISGSNQWFFDSVSGGGSVSFKPKILAAFSTVDNSYQAQLSISYRDHHGVSHSETRSIGFTARGIAVLTLLDSQTSPPATPPGSVVSITGNILNKGTTSAFYTALSVKPSSGIRQALEETTYLGEV
ncbi:MAG: COG1361 S-layer family protein, partial [Nitrososphaerales archaeon]